MPRRDEHDRLPLVRRSRRRQGGRAADRVPDCPRYARRTRDELPENEPGTRKGIAGDPQAVDGVMRFPVDPLGKPLAPTPLSAQRERGIAPPIPSPACGRRWREAPDEGAREATAGG